MCGGLAGVLIATAWFVAHANGWPLAVPVVVSVAVVVLGAIPPIRYGHYGFKGGGNTDLLAYVFAIGVTAAIMLPRIRDWYAPAT